MSTLYEDFRDRVGIVLDSWSEPEAVLPPNHDLDLEDPDVAAGQGTTFVDWLTIDDRQEKLTFGSSLVLRGSVVLNVWSQAGNTDLRARQIIDSLGDLFRAANEPGITFFEPEVPGGYVPLGAYSIWPVEIPYLFQGGIVAPGVTRHPQPDHGFVADDVPMVLEASGSTWVAAPTAWPWKSTVGLLVGVLDDATILVQEQPGPVLTAGVSIAGTPGQDLYRSQSVAGVLDLFTPPAKPAAGGSQRLGGILPSGRVHWNPEPAELI